jgi:hypothetical protein
VMVELAASIFSACSTCKLLPSFSHVTLFIATIWQPESKIHSTISFPSTSGKIEQRGMEWWPTQRSSVPLGSCIAHPLYTVGLSSGTSSSLPTSVVPADTRRVVVNSLYCFHASGEIDNSSCWVMETGTSRARLTTLRTMAGSSTGWSNGTVDQRCQRRQYF